MKASNYNFFYTYEANNNKMIAYNAYSNTLALVDKDKHDMYSDFADKGECIPDEGFAKQLAQTNFIIEDSANELDRLRLRMFKSRYRSDMLGLAIAVTADCNFRCPYCFERVVIRPEYMSKNVEDAVLKYVKNYSRTIRNLNIYWYGGEPLLALDVLERLSRCFIEICDKNNINYNAKIVTNGYLLSRETIRLLGEIKVSSIQMTIDGNKEKHDSLRHLADGSGTYDTIMNNLVDNVDILPEVSMRLNVSKDNIAFIKDIVQILKDKGLDGKVTPYVERIKSDNDEYGDVQCFGMQSFSKELLDHYEESSNNGNNSYFFPRRIENYCAADCLNNMVIDASGKIYKCVKEVGKPDRHVGHVEPTACTEPPNLQLLSDYLLYDPTLDPQCSKCDALPICMGGCPLQRVSDDKDKCGKYKYILDGLLKIAARKLRGTFPPFRYMIRG